MDIYSRIKNDHDCHRAMAEKIMQTSGDSSERRELFEEYKNDVVAHANAEEQSFYAILIEDEKTQEQTRHSVSEHKEASDLFEELEEMDMSSSGWIQKFKKLKEELEHHMTEEEEEVFDMAHKAIPKDKEEPLADKFDRRKQDELKDAA